MGTSDAAGDAVAVRIAHSGLAEDVIVVEWFVADGAVVQAGSALVRLESEKTEIDLDAPVTGRLEVLVPVSDDEVPVGTLIGWIHP